MDSGSGRLESFPHSPTDTVFNFNRPGTAMTDQDRPGSIAQSDFAQHIQPPFLFRARSLERSSTLTSCNSSTSLVSEAARGTHQQRGRPGHAHASPSRSSPFFFNWPPQAAGLIPEPGATYRAWEEKRTHAIRRREKGATKWYHGWKVILFGSWLNLLLLVVPVSWVLHTVMENSHTLDFIFCTISMIPLVKMHDLATQDLALRIGGSKTGLLNASLSNMVEMVIAITALRKCELRVVQSSLIGSMLSKMLLVLGTCFFAGGLRFSEQDFNADATQIHSSLLSISVGALLLPAAYHFAISATDEETGHTQKIDILKMSHGVSIILLVVYCGYLIFQLWSHTHFYTDHPSNHGRSGSKLLKPLRPTTAAATPRSSPAPSPYGSRSSSHARARTTESDVTIAAQPEDWSHVNLDEESEKSRPVSRGGSTSAFSDDSTQCPSPLASTHAEREKELEKEKEKEEDGELQPELSWFMTIFLMTAVTVMVSFNAEWLVSSLDTISTTISKEWIALIMLPAISSIAECVTAANVSMKDQLTLSVSVAVSSTIQTALFVIPFMVTLGWALGKPLALLFDPFESVVLYISVQVMTNVVADGKSNWLEGMILTCLYVIIAISFWFYPGSDFSSHLSVCV